MLGRTHLHPTSLPPIYVTNENYFFPLFQAKEKTDLTKHARRQHPPPQYIQVSFSLSHPSSASPFTPGHPPPTLHALESSGNASGWKDCCIPRRCLLRAASGSYKDHTLNVAHSEALPTLGFLYFLWTLSLFSLCSSHQGEIFLPSVSPVQSSGSALSPFP